MSVSAHEQQDRHQDGRNENAGEDAESAAGGQSADGAQGEQVAGAAGEHQRAGPNRENAPTAVFALAAHQDVSALTR